MTNEVVKFMLRSNKISMFHFSAVEICFPRLSLSWQHMEGETTELLGEVPERKWHSLKKTRISTRRKRAVRLNNECHHHH